MKNTKMLAEELKILRAKKRLTQRELAKKSGISEMTIVYLEQNRIESPRYETVIKLAEALGVKAKDLLQYVID